jgi:hypothetical protein
MSALCHKPTHAAQQFDARTASTVRDSFKVFRAAPRFAGSRLVDLDSDRRDERRPFDNLGFDEAPEFFWR